MADPSCLRSDTLSSRRNVGEPCCAPIGNIAPRVASSSVSFPAISDLACEIMASKSVSRRVRFVGIQGMMRYLSRSSLLKQKSQGAECQYTCDMSAGKGVSLKWRYALSGQAVCASRTHGDPSSPSNDSPRHESRFLNSVRNVRGCPRSPYRGISSHSIS